jgi:hypothetical protein
MIHIVPAWGRIQNKAKGCEVSGDRMVEQVTYDIVILAVVILASIYIHMQLPLAPQAYTCAPGFDYNFL